VQKDERNRMQPRSQKCIYLGFENGYKGWHCLNPTTKCIIISCDVIFNESEFPGHSPGNTNQNSLQPVPTIIPNEASAPPDALPDLNPPIVHHPDDPQPIHDPPIPDPPAPDPVPLPAEPRWSSRTTARLDYRYLHDPLLRLRPPPDHDDPGPEGGAAASTSMFQALEFMYNELEVTRANMISPSTIELAFNVTIKDDHIPQTFAEAMQRSDAPLWKDSTDAEIQVLLDNRTWKLVRLPPGVKAIGSWWVFLIKLNLDGSLDKYKSHLVAKEYTQWPGIDYDEVFAPTTWWAALWMILTRGALQGAYVESVDISNAYLNRILDNKTQIYMEQPEGYHQGGADWVCKLKQGLYVLKQSGRLWYERLGTALESMGFTRVQSDISIYTQTNETVMIVAPVFVNDLTLVSNSKQDLDRVKSQLAEVFKLKDLGATKSLLGMEVEYDFVRKPDVEQPLSGFPPWSASVHVQKGSGASLGVKVSSRSIVPFR
jgi:Reverse transcriptase (RNA-dependent DNA polymerase)